MSPAPLPRVGVGGCLPMLCSRVPLHGVPSLGQCQGVQAPCQGPLVAHDHILLQQWSSLCHFMSV